ALTVNGTAATGGGSASYSSSGSFTISARSEERRVGKERGSRRPPQQTTTKNSTNGTATGSCRSYGSATTSPRRPHPITLTHIRRRRHHQLPIPDHLQLDRSSRRLRLTNDHLLLHRAPHGIRQLPVPALQPRALPIRPHRQRNRRHRRRQRQLLEQRQLHDQR